jgi:hypothetical protein
MSDHEAEDSDLAASWIEWMSKHWKGVRRVRSQPLVLEFTVGARSTTQVIFVEFVPEGLGAAIPRLTAEGKALGFHDDQAWGALGTAAEDIAVSSALRSVTQDTFKVEDLPNPGFPEEPSPNHSFTWGTRQPD